MLLNYSNTEKGCKFAEHNKQDGIFTFFSFGSIYYVWSIEIFIQFCSAIIY